MKTEAEAVADAVRAYKRRLRRILDKAFAVSRNDADRFHYLLVQLLHTIYREQRGGEVAGLHRAVLDAAYDYKRAHALGLSAPMRWFERRAARHAFERAALRLPDETV
jgi:hypothetical protein